MAEQVDAPDSKSGGAAPRAGSIPALGTSARPRRAPAPVDPYYRRHLFFCVNERADEACCQDHDARAMRDYAKARCKTLGIHGAGQVRVNQCGCLDRCAEGPVAVVYPDGIWYRYRTRADIDRIIDEHLRHGRPVRELEI